MLLERFRSSKVKPSLYFSEAQLNLLNPSRIPKHIAIIPDGNRRWAKRNLLSIHKGHRQGSDILIHIVKAAIELGIEALTFYAFSTENWARPQLEIDVLMKLMINFLEEYQETMQENGIRLEVIGDLSSLPKELQQTITHTKQATHQEKKMRLILAINYGARDELARAFKKMMGDYDLGLFKKEGINSDLISNYLDTAEWSDPDLLIRTSGETRISNYLLWQLSYAEMHFTDVLWPDFKPENLLNALIDYQKRERRWGKDG
jgi:undecaprenyl diphosphate synthase